MTKPWVALVVGGCGVLAIAIAVNHFRSDEPGGAGQGSTRMARLADRAIAERSGGHSVESGDAGAVGSGGASAGKGAAVGSGSGAIDSGRARAGAEVITSGRRSGSGIGASGSTGRLSEGGTIRLDAPREAAVKFERRGGLSGSVGDGGTVRGADEAFPFGEDTTQEDPDGPKVALSFKGTVDPEAGEPPVLQEGVTVTEEGAKFPEDARFAIPNPGLTGEAGTFSFTVQPDWSGAEETDASLVQFRNPNDWNNRIQITKNGQYLRFIFTDDTGNESGAGIAIRWNPGEQHQVTATWGEDSVTGQKLASLYVDGRLAGQSPYYGSFNPPNGPIYIGSDLPGGGPGARGLLSDFKVYGRRLTGPEVSGQ